MLPDFLCHYYSCAGKPFRSLTTLPPDAAEALLEQIRQRGEGFASQRQPDYLTIRRELETRVRELFIAQGGQPLRERPHYMILGACDWLKSWYTQGCELRVPLARFNPRRVSFTYGDTFPAMRFADGKSYRQQVYTLEALPEIVQRYGLPQEGNADGAHGPDRYIEAQVWEDAPLREWL